MKQKAGFNLPELDEIISSDLSDEEKVTQALQMLSIYNILERYMNLSCRRENNSPMLQAHIEVDDAGQTSWTWPTVDPWHTEIPWDDRDTEYGCLEIYDAVRMASELGVDMIRFRSSLGEVCIPVPLAEAEMDI